MSGLPANLSFVDNGNGTGSVSGPVNVIPAVYKGDVLRIRRHQPCRARHGGDYRHEGETTLTYTGPTVILNGGNVTLTARLTEDDPSPVDAGKTVSFTLGAQSCNGTTNASGVASCVIAVSSALGGSIPITATFLGDAFYEPSADAATAIVFAFPTRGGFVVGDVSAGLGGTVTWWASNWSKANLLSGGAGPSGFKGFAGTVTLPTSTPPVPCGGPWSTSGGSSPPPVETIPSFMGTLVASSATKSGTVISGNTVSIVVVHVNPATRRTRGVPVPEPS